MRLFFIAKFWIPLVFVITLLCGLIYLSVQQNFRMSANDPQIQIAEDGAARLAAGEKAENLIGSSKVDIEKSLAPFAIVYDQSGTVVSTSALLQNGSIHVPPGVLQAARSLGENRFTWQPKYDTRIAAVVVAYAHGYVLAGRSLREVEIREEKLTLYVAAAWISGVIGSFFIICCFELVLPYVKKK